MEENIAKNEEEKSIDEILLFIKLNKFNKEKIKKDLGIDLGIKKFISEESATIQLNGKQYEIKPQSRMILFKGNEKSVTKFICSHKHLKQVLDNLNFKAISIDDNDEDSGDSLSSENSGQEIIDIFNNTNIIEIHQDKTNLEKIVEKFNNRYKDTKIYISDLSLNSSFYFPDNKNDKINYILFGTFENEIDTFFAKECSILYVVGPKGTSKSLFLMDYCYNLNEVYKIPLLYINYRKMKDLEFRKKKNIFKKELVYLFFEEEKLKKFYKEKDYELIASETLLKFIYDFIKNLMNKYKDNFNEQIICVIDNLDEDNENEMLTIQNLISLVKEEENRKKIKLIISGRCKFLYKKQLLYLKNELSIKKSNNREMLLYYNLELSGSNKSKDMASLPLYFFNQTVPKDNLISEEIKFCQKFNPYGMHYSIFNEEKDITTNELEYYYEMLPIDFIVFTKKENNIISFKFHNEIFKSAVKKSIEFSIQSNIFMYILKKFDKNRITIGIFEEKILTLFFEFNKLNLNDLIFIEENKLEIYEIFQFKYSKYNKTNKIINKNEPIIITQENYMGKNYDLLILVPMPYINSYKAYFIQIGTNKNKIQINDIKKDLNDDQINYKKGIKKFIG